jgi:hypothetical protein
MREALRKRRAMVAEWGRKGHPATACVGHTYPLPDCPKPDAHTFPEVVQHA